jgi:hypothetical protein
MAPSENPPMKGKWIDLINESVHTADDVDIGDIDAVNIDFNVVKRGFVNIHYYYIPIHKVEGWDGHVSWLKIAEAETRSKYERDMVPDPSRYYVKDYPYYAATNYPDLLIIQPLIIQPRHKRPVFTPAPTPDIPPVHKCNLCDSTLHSGEELSKHVASQH